MRLNNEATLFRVGCPRARERLELTLHNGKFRPPSRKCCRRLLQGAEIVLGLEPLLAVASDH